MKEIWERVHLETVYFDEHDSVLLSSGGGTTCRTVCLIDAGTTGCTGNTVPCNDNECSSYNGS